MEWSCSSRPDQQVSLLPQSRRIPAHLSEASAAVDDERVRTALLLISSLGTSQTQHTQTHTHAHSRVYCGWRDTHPAQTWTWWTPRPVFDRSVFSILVERERSAGELLDEPWARGVCCALFFTRRACFSLHINVPQNITMKDTAESKDQQLTVSPLTSYFPALLSSRVCKLCSAKNLFM